MSYFTIKNTASSIFEEKKSIFIGNVKRIYTETEARDFIAEIKSKHKEAAHNVYAYCIGEKMDIQRYSDDGEPQGTAGIPVLDAIKKNLITDTVVVVTRYFGGTLLGAGVLVRAYSKSASAAIKEAGVIEKVRGVEISIIIEYDLLGKVQYAFAQKLWHIEEVSYSDKVQLKLYCEPSNTELIKKEIFNISSGKAELSVSEEKYYFKLQNRLYEDD